MMLHLPSNPGILACSDAETLSRHALQLHLGMSQNREKKKKGGWAFLQHGLATWPLGDDSKLGHPKTAGGFSPRLNLPHPNPHFSLLPNLLTLTQSLAFGSQLSAFRPAALGVGLPDHLFLKMDSCGWFPSKQLRVTWNMIRNCNECRTVASVD